MSEIKYIDLKQCILEDNTAVADQVRALAREHGFFLLNIMSSPGAGKTTFILDLIRRLGATLRIGVIEGDIESTMDAEKMQALGVPTVQLRTGGDCHLDAPMIQKALQQLPTRELDLVIVENIGNLVCPAEFDLGANLAIMLLSIPEGDDKAVKYPLMFTVTQALIVTKMDVQPYFNFDMDALHRNARRLNPDLQIFPVSALRGEGMEEVCRYLLGQIQTH